MLKISYESTPRSAIDRRILDKVDEVSVTHLPNDSFSATVDGVKRINDAAGRNIAYPHIGARNISNPDELISGLESIDKETTRVLLVGGAGSENIFNNKIELYHFLEDAGLVNYTFLYNVDPNISLLDRLTDVEKYTAYGFYAGMNQLCLNPHRLAWWENRITPCLPTKTTAKGMWRYMKLCGVTTSLRGMWANMYGVHYINKGRIDVWKFWQDFTKHTQGKNKNHVHFFNFGNLERTIDEFQERS